MARARTWTDDELRAAIAVSRNMRMVLRRLGVRPGGKTYRAILARADALAIDTSHFTTRTTVTTDWTDDDLRAAVASSRSLREAIMKLGLVGAGGNFRTIARGSPSSRSTRRISSGEAGPAGCALPIAASCRSPRSWCVDARRAATS